MLATDTNSPVRTHEPALFDALSASVDDDGVVTVHGHSNDDGGFYPTTVVRLDSDTVTWLATTLVNLARRAAA